MQDKKQEIVEIYSKLVNSLKREPTLVDLSHKGVSRAQVRSRFDNLSGLKKVALKANPKLFKNVEVAESEQKRTILEVYRDGVLSTRRPLSGSDLKDRGITRDKIRHHFGSIRGLRLAARKAFSKEFKAIIDDTLFDDKSLSKLERIVKSSKRLVITTAVTGAPLDTDFFKSIKRYCKEQKAQLLVIPVADPAAMSDGWVLDSAISPEVVVSGNLEINDSLYVSGLRMSAKQIDPTTGLDRCGSKQSFIYGSPKQRLRVVPTSNEKLPHVVMGTGAITLPNYDTERYMSQRTAYLADLDHIMGAVVVEFDDKGLYHFRQLQRDSKGGIIDLGTSYSHKKLSKVTAKAFVLGDFHAGEEDPSAVQAWKEVCELVEPEKIVLHDLFNGKSISHHDFNKILGRASLADQGLLSLKEELEVTAKALDYMLTWKGVKQLVVVKSNHDEFLYRYLDDGRFLKDSPNFQLAIDLISAFQKGQDPVQTGVELFLNPKNKGKIKWLQRDEDFKIEGIQCGAHGDKGPNGARGTLANHEKAYGKCVIGHRHQPEILRGAYQVGTTSFLDLSYAVGPSSWLHTSCLIYPEGVRQLINSIDGFWRKS